jgi:pimeloyl-ACP methyl ester carboxylesterase
VMVDQLKLDSVYVIGWSDGGIAGLLLANYRPDKIKRLLISGANYKSREIKGIDDAAKTVLDADWVEVNWKEWVVNYKKLSPQGNEWKRYFNEGKNMWLTDEYFSKQILEEIKIPVLVTYGDNDIIKLNHGIEIKKALKKSQFCIIPNCSHEVFNEKPDLIDKIAIDFFTGK